jgi:hypothetical protein
MNNLVCSVASYLVNAVWEVALIGGAGWAVSRLLRRLGPQVEHVLWVVTLALAIVTPALPLWRWLGNAIFASVGMREHLSIAFVAMDGGKSNAAAALLPPVVIYTLLVCYVTATNPSTTVTAAPTPAQCIARRPSNPESTTVCASPPAHL